MHLNFRNKTELKFCTKKITMQKIINGCQKPFCSIPEHHSIQFCFFKIQSTFIQFCLQNLNQIREGKMHQKSEVNLICSRFVVLSCSFFEYNKKCQQYPKCCVLSCESKVKHFYFLNYQLTYLAILCYSI